MSRDYAQTCFVDMPFGRKVDPATGVEIDFDQIYKDGIKPAVEAAGLQCIRGDKEDSGGRCQSKIPNTWSGHRTAQIDPEKCGKINGREIRL